MESSTRPEPRIVPLLTLVEDSTNASDIIAACRAFEPSGENDQRQRYRLPRDIYHGVEALAMDCGEHNRPKARQSTFLFCLLEGLSRLGGFPNVKEIGRARRVAIECGSTDASWFDEFKFEIDTRHLGNRNFNARKVDESISTGTARLSDDLGLSGNTVAVLAVATVLFDAPAPHAFKVRLMALLADFAEQLVRRGVRAQKIAAEAVRDRSEPSPLTFADFRRSLDAKP